MDFLYCSSRAGFSSPAPSSFTAVARQFFIALVCRTPCLSQAGDDTDDTNTNSDWDWDWSPARCLT